MTEQQPDLHVDALNYALEHSPQVAFDKPAPVEHDNSVARYRLADGRLRCELKEHFADEASARAAVEPLLRAWELNAELSGNIDEMRFRFVDSEIVDRSPHRRSTGQAIGSLPTIRIIPPEGTAHVTRTAYRPAPESFTVTPDVESMAERYRGYREGREPLPAMAYFVLTVLELIARDRSKAATRFDIEPAVLSKVGELSSARGDGRTARKAKAAHAPLTGKEIAWLDAAIKALIFQVGDTRTAPSRPRLRMQDLPPL